MKKVTLLFLVVVLGKQVVCAQEYIGKSSIKIFTRSQYGGGAQNWAIAQDKKNRLYIANNEGLNIRPKQDDDEQMGRAAEHGKSSNATIDWENYCTYFNSTKKEDLLPVISRFVLQTPAAPDAAILSRHSNVSARQLDISSLTINLMSCPEYQLC